MNTKKMKYILGVGLALVIGVALLPGGKTADRNEIEPALKDNAGNQDQPPTESEPVITPPEETETEDAASAEAAAKKAAARRARAKKAKAVRKCKSGCARGCKGAHNKAKCISHCRQACGK